MVNYASEESQLIYARKGHLFCVAGRKFLRACAPKLLDVCYILQGKKLFLGALRVVAKSAFYCCHARLLSVRLSVGPPVLTSVSPPVCLHVSARLPLEGFPWNLTMGTSRKFCPENPNFLVIWQKYRSVFDATSRYRNLSNSEKCNKAQEFVEFWEM